MDEFEKARSWTILFLTGFYQSLWKDFFHSFRLMPKIIALGIFGGREKYVEHIVGQISLKAHDAAPPPPDVKAHFQENTREMMFLLGWTATGCLWFCPRLRIDVVTKLAPVIERKWQFKGWLT